MLGFGIMLFLENDKTRRKTLEEHFQAAVRILEKHLQEKKPKRKGAR
jgi:hypothetical protein